MARTGASKRPEARKTRYRQRAQRRRWYWWAGAAAVLIAIVAGAVVFTQRRRGGGASATTLPALTPQGGHGQPVDGIRCETEQLAYHIHAHLALIVDGEPVAVPAGIGIAPLGGNSGSSFVSARCLYWLHTHDGSGVIHVESPAGATYTLGQFFAVWGEPLTGSNVAGFAVTSGEPMHVFVDGKPYDGGPGDIPLRAHGLITLEIGKQEPSPGFTFPPGL